MKGKRGEDGRHGEGGGHPNHSHQHQQGEGETPSAGILTQAKLHKHRRTPSKEQSELSSLQSDSNHSTPSRAGEDSHPQSHSTPPLSRSPPSRSTPPTSRSTPPRSTPTPSREMSQTPTLSQPDVVRQRRTGSPARDLSFKSPSPSFERKTGDRCSPQLVEPRSVATPPVLEDGPETSLVLSETFTIDKAKSFLHNLTTPQSTSGDPANVEGGGGGGFVKGHQRKRSKDLNVEGGVSTPHRDRSSPDREHVPSSSQSESHTGEEGGKVRTHRRTRSRDLNTPTSMDDARKDEEGGGSRERERCTTPVLVGRRRTNSRPSSPMLFNEQAPSGEHHDTDVTGSDSARRMTNAENLAQRLGGLRKTPSPITVSGGTRGEHEDGEKKSPPFGNRSRKQSPSSDSLPDSQDETPRPTSLRHRTHSVGSESDLVSVVGGKKDPGVVSNLLTKLGLFARNQESKLAERTTRLRQRSSEEEQHRRSGGRTRHKSESDNDMSSDPGSHLPPRAPATAAASDSSSGSHSDDSKARSHRHRR